MSNDDYRCRRRNLCFNFSQIIITMIWAIIWTRTSSARPSIKSNVSLRQRSLCPPQIMKIVDWFIVVCLQTPPSLLKQPDFPFLLSDATFNYFVMENNEDWGVIFSFWNWQTTLKVVGFRDVVLRIIHDFLFYCTYSFVHASVGSDYCDALTSCPLVATSM